MNEIRISESLSLPVDVSGQAVAIFGLRGSGKTNTAGVMAEELMGAGHQICVLDPTDAWWGLRAGKDGSPSGGYPIVIFGGTHADVPLNETDGKIIAEFVVKEQVSVIISLRHLRKNAQRRFVTDFCEEVYHLKGKPENRTPLTVFIDESPLFVPQKVMGEVARTVGAVEDLIARGRNAGFGVVLISQRSATLNADVRTQCDTIICHRVTAPLDRKAIRDWFEENATTEDLATILKSLATMKNGEGWVWAPSVDVMQKAQMRLRRTFDSSKTPKIGEKVQAPKRLADIDLDKLKAKLASAIEQKKQDDPVELRKTILDLRRQLQSAPVVDVAEAQKASTESFALGLAQGRKEAVSIAERCLKQAIQEISCEGLPVIPPSRAIPVSPHVPAKTTVKATRVIAGNSDLSGPEKRILNAIAWLESIGVSQPEQTAVAFLAGYTVGGGGFNNPRGALRTKGLIKYAAGDRLVLTDAGRDSAEYPDAVLTSDKLQEMVFSRLPGPESKILREILNVWPGTISNEVCAERSGYTNGGGGYNNPRGRLKTLGLIEYPSPGLLRARDILFPDRRA